MTDTELHTRVAIAVYGKKRVHVTGDGEVLVFYGLAKRFNYRTHSMEYQPSWLITSLDACQRDLLPDLERRGFKTQQRFEKAIDDAGEYWVRGILNLTPRQWCEAYVEAIVAVRGTEE